jgi:FkbM family methyltransferase
VELRSSFDFDTALQVFGGQDYDLSLVGLDTKIEAVMSSARARNCVSLIVDVGANIGLSALFFAREYPSSHVLAIEPSPENCDLIVKNTRGVDPSRIKIIQAALVADKSAGEVFLDISSGNNAFRTSDIIANSMETNKIIVPALGLSGLMQEVLDQEYHPTILKIDVEGAESEIFRAGTDVVDKFSLIVLEPHDWLLGEPVSSSFLAFHSRNNRLFKMRSENIFSLRGD